MSLNSTIPITLTPQQSADLQALSNAGDYPGAYRFLRDIVDQVNGDPGLMAWFDAAAHVNANDGSFWSEFTRGSTEGMGDLVGHPISDARFQEASDTLARKVIDDFLRRGAIPGTNTILDSDVAAAVDALGLPPYGWAGTLGAPFLFGTNTWRNFTGATPREMGEQIAQTLVAAEGGGLFRYLEAQWPNTLQALQGLHGLFQQAAGSMGSPIVLDLDGDGVETTNIGAGAFFDLDANGFAEKTGWVGKDDGLLVWDRNGDSRIDSGRELFGNETLLASGEKAANGFVALAELDTNHDGALDASDAAFANLKVWKDADGDGLSSPDELISLADAGVASINIGYSNSSYVDPQGNTHRQVGSFSRTDGTSGTATDVWFQRNLIDTVAEEWLAVPADVAALPDLRGYGNVYDLHQAMVRDASGELKSLVQSFAAETDVQARNALFEEILFKWTGAGPYWDTMEFRFPDGRRLEVLEKLFGETYVSSLFGYHGITPTGAGLLTQAYQSVFEMFYGQLMAQTHLKPEFDRITYTWDSATRSLKGDLAAVGAYLDSQLQANPEAGKTEVDEFVRSVHGLKAEAMLPFNTLHGGDRLTWLVGSDGMQRTEGTDGADTITTTSSNPFAVWAGAGDDLIQSGSTNDLLYGNDGNDTIVDMGGSNTIYGGAGDDHITTSDEQHWASTVVNTIYGGAGDDVIDVAQSQLFDLNGDWYGHGNTLAGGTGNDVLIGGVGSDIYLFDRGDGQDTIEENSVARFSIWNVWGQEFP